MASATARVKSLAVFQCLTNSAAYLDDPLASSAAKAAKETRAQRARETNNFIVDSLLWVSFRFEQLNITERMEGNIGNAKPALTQVSPSTRMTSPVELRWRISMSGAYSGSRYHARASSSDGNSSTTIAVGRG